MPLLQLQASSAVPVMLLETLLTDHRFGCPAAV
jgi:hypothetical protein